MATQTFQFLYTSLFEMTYNLCKKQVNETVWEKLFNLILIKKYLRPYFDRQPCKNISLFIIIYKNFVSIKKQMNVEIMQWDLRLSDVVKFKSIISLAQLHGQLNPPSALPFTCVVLFGPTDIRSPMDNGPTRHCLPGTVPL
jgi:hypothetical protein